MIDDEVRARIAHDQKKQQRGCFGCLAVFGVIIIIIIIGLAAGGGGHRDGVVPDRQSNPGWAHKAVASERQAAKVVGGWNTDETKMLYLRGVQHITNQHQRLGSFTIGQVIDQERSREDQRASVARDIEQKRHAANDAAARQAQAAEDARYMHGTPDCLVMLKSSLHTSSGEYTWYIDGKVINKCDHDFRYAQVSFNFYDSAGNMQNSGLININNLEAGTTWAFHKAVYESNTDGGTFRVEKIEGF